MFSFLYFPAILRPPTVLSLTTLAVGMEIQGPNGSAKYIYVEHALVEFGSISGFQQGARITVVNRKNMYRLSQRELLPGRTYHIRVVPWVVLPGNKWYKGIPSNTTQVMTPAPGTFSSIDLAHTILCQSL